MRTTYTTDPVAGCPWAGDNSDPQAQRLLERVVESGNMKRAWQQVKQNGGSAGVDGRSIVTTMVYLREAWPRIRQALLDETYVPYPVRRVEIPKPNGGTRKLGVPTVVDRLIQPREVAFRFHAVTRQAICQVLVPIFDPHFSTFSYGFRPHRSAHDAVRQARQYQQDGKQWVVDMDLKQFFDEVDHAILMARVGRRITDKRLKRLINAFLKAGVVLPDGTRVPTDKGTPQGGPLSPLLSNILLDDLDKELERRQLSFCRYADDCNIYVASKRAGERVMRSVTEFVEKRLKLKVNRAKSAVARPWTRKFLGFTTQKVFGQIRTAVPDVSIQRFTGKLKALFHVARGRNVARFIRETLTPTVRGWFQYFVLGASRRQLQTLDYWIRRHLRCIIWRQWKRPSTRLRKLRALGISQDDVYVAYNRRGPWRNAALPQLTHALSPDYFRNLGLFGLVDGLHALRTTSTTEPPCYGFCRPAEWCESQGRATSPATRFSKKEELNMCTGRSASRRASNHAVRD